MLAVCGQVPTEEIGSEFFQEVNNDVLFSDVAVFTHTVTSAAQMPQMLEQAVNTAYARQGVAVLTMPGDIGDLEMTGDEVPRFVPRPAQAAAPVTQIQEAAQVLSDASDVTLLVGHGALDARAQVLALADRLQAPMVLTLKAKECLEQDNPYQVGQTGLIGNPAAAKALDDCDVLFLIGTDFPYREWLPTGKTVIQLDARAEHVGRRINVEHALIGHTAPTLDGLLPLLTDGAPSSKHLDKCTKEFHVWHEAQLRLTHPEHDKKLLGRIRSLGDNPDKLIRPEVVARALNDHAAPDAIFTSDTGMSTVWLSRFIEFTGTRRLLGSYNLGSMANAMPQALGAQAVDRERQVIACCGDGGLMMLLGDLRTAVTYNLPATFVVFDNGRLGMVKLEQEQGGLPEYGTELDNPDIAAVAAAMGLEAVRVTYPEDVEPAIQRALAARRPALLDIVTNPDEISIPPKPKLAQAWGFAIAKSKENLESR